jgi:DNA-binding response OmpR family regulator
MSASKTVLIVEEEDALREELAFQLRADGHRVVTLEDGFELCDYLELALHRKVPPPKMIISDVDLAGLSGGHICNMLSKAEDAVPFILLARHVEDGAGVGAICVLNKEAPLVELYAVIAGCLEDLTEQRTTAA